MSEEKGHNITDEQLFRHFAGELDEAMEKSIVKWRDASDENLAKYQETQIFYLDVKALSSLKAQPRQYNVDDAWGKLNIAPQKPVQEWTGAFMKIAASVLLVVSLGWLAYDQLLVVENKSLAAIDEVMVEELADGSTISLNEGSALNYPDKFRGNERRVELTGEAYFEVTPNPDKPFVVETKDLEIQVLGTEFNVDSRSESDTVKVVVDGGLVKVVANEQSEELPAGASAIYVRSTQTLVRLDMGTVSTHNYWRTKSLSFNSSQLIDVVETLEEVYKVQIGLSNEAMAHCKITVSFEDESIEDILDVIAATLNLEMTNSNGEYLLEGDSCE